MATIPRRRNSTILLPAIILISLCIIAVTITSNLHKQNSGSNVSVRRTITDTLMSSQEQPQQPRKHTMVGGYSNLGHDKALLKSEQVRKVANFALKEYAAKTTETATNEEHSLTVSPGEVESGEVTAVVLEAQRQVVAGLNYKLTIALIKDSICLGAIKVTVWDHFGELKVTKWGDKLLPWEDVQELFNEVQAEEEEKKALEVEGEIEEGMDEVEPNE